MYSLDEWKQIWSKNRFEAFVIAIEYNHVISHVNLQKNK